ncbi:hypothetical protein TSAR_007327 [Trichomalopsis sarcophagae]|uniref:Serendipity locus protein alpha n=1 Tax=Trichomalopsis sarcophagae TaxID=543379 RepID=A0A232FIE3_9HYME|nr:hypothetical protein TSAR_007327 [Trichomalopsis sarcophagae]
MTLKTKQMLRIFNPIDELIKKLEELLNDNEANSVEKVCLKKLICDQLNALAQKFDAASNDNVDSYREMKKKVTAIIEEFCIMDFKQKDNQLEGQIDKQIFGSVTEKFLSLLENLEKSETFSIKQSLQDCLLYVKEMGSACEIEDLQNIKELGASIAEIFKPLQIYKRNLTSNLLADKLALFCCQLCTSFGILVLVIKEQHQLNVPIYTCKKYICERLCLCFESIIGILDAPNPSEEDEHFELENNFVYRIDLVLDIISDLSSKAQSEQVNDCADLWFGIEDVFAHAMSIAQICQPYSFKAISGSCQTILTEYENLKKQLQSDPPDPTMNNLFMNTLTDSLYRLERKINISVLTLVMEVFSDPFGALKRLIKICGTSLHVSERTTNDLDSAIEEFDQLSDKAVLIGKFAIACCRDKNRAARIKNCLASFESLEMELIPAVSAFYLHPNNKEMRACVKLLTEQWQFEMNRFHHTVNLIIDPAAYCQIVLDDLQERINEMSNSLDNRQDITQLQVQHVVQRALSLSKQINATLEDVGQENIDKQAIMTIREFKAGIYEADAASKKFLINKATAPEQLRVIHRCEIMLKVIKRLLPVLSNIVNNSVTMGTVNTAHDSKSKAKKSLICTSAVGLSSQSSFQELSIVKKSSNYIRTPYSVKSCKKPLSIQPANTVLRNESDVSILIPYIEKGRMMRAEWSVMYKTPQTCKSEKPIQNMLKIRNLSSVRQHLFSRDSFLDETEIDLTSESLDLTNILENITGLSETLTSVASNKSTFDNSKSTSSSSEQVIHI